MVKKIIHLACLVALISSLLLGVFMSTPVLAEVGVVGKVMIDQGGSVANGYTRIADGASNFEGTITTVYFWPVGTAWTGTRVGTFYYVSGTTWTCRDSVYVGDVAVGLQSVSVNLHVHIGDYIGFWQQGSNNYVGVTTGNSWSCFGGRANKVTTGTSWTYNYQTTYSALCRGEGAITEPPIVNCVSSTLDIATLDEEFPTVGYVGITDATLWGQVLEDGNESCQGFFEWGLVGGTDSEYTPEDSELYTGNYSSYYLDGLEASTEYWFSFNLYNSETYDIGGYSTFITESNNPEAMAYGSHSITDTTAHLQGEVLQIGNYTSWTCGRFYYTDGVISAWTPCQGGMYNLLIVEHAIGNLTPDTDYTWWFLVQTDAGYDYSDSMTFHTLDRTTNTIPRVVTNVAELSQWYVDGAWTFGFKFKGYLHDDGGLPCTYGFEYRGNGTSDDWTPYDLGRRAYQGQEFWAYKFGFTRGVVIEYRATCLNTAGRGYGDSRVIELPAVGPVPTVVPTPGPGIELPPWLQFPFSISSTIKTILGVIITVILMVLIVAMIRSSGGTVAAVAAGLGLTLVFIVIGWYPLWIGLLIGAIVGLLIFLMLMRGK